MKKPAPIGTVTWTPEEDAFIQASLTEGLTYAQIGARLNTTRNAVIGRSKRIGLVGPEHARIKAKEKQQARAEGVVNRLPAGHRRNTKPALEKKRIERIEAARLRVVEAEKASFVEALMEMRCVPLMDLEKRECRFEVHGAKRWVSFEDMRFCGRPVAAGAKWCSEHLHMCYTPRAIRGVSMQVART
jgi:hypothetical protein